MSALLDQKTLNQVRDAFAQLQQPVRVLFFGARKQCEYCD